MKEEKATKQADEKINPLKNIPLDMYTISGNCDTITEKTLKRYLDCMNHNVEEALDYSGRVQAIQKADKADKIKLIEKLFDIEFNDFKLLVPDLVVFVSSEEKLEWIKLGLQSVNPRVWRCVCFVLPYLPKIYWKEITPIIRQKVEYILNNNNDDLAVGVPTISILPDEEQIPIIKKLLSHKNLEIQKYASWIIKPLSNPADLVDICLKSNNIKVQQSGIDYITKVKWNDLSKRLEDFSKQLLINLSNDGDNRESLLTAFYVFDYLTLDSKIELIKIGMKSSYSIIRERAYESIATLPVAKQRELLTIMGKTIIDIFKDRQLNQEKVEFILLILWHLPKLTTKRLLAFGFFQMMKNKVDNKLVLLFEIFNAKNKKDLIKLKLSKEFVNDFVSNSLYKKYDVDDKNFKRQRFEKTGSETTLMGGKLKDKIIVRYIKPYPFLLWKHLYENHRLWKENGFDYVPIEPIVSYDLCKDNLVRVFSGVLDLDFYDLEHKVSVYTKELRCQKDKIIAVLEKENVIHGHCHDKNFVLRFFRNQDGFVDLNKTPRIYLIDFDQVEMS